MQMKEKVDIDELHDEVKDDLSDSRLHMAIFFGFLFLLNLAVLVATW